MKKREKYLEKFKPKAGFLAIQPAVIATALSVLLVSSANANPPNSHAVGTTWYCKSGYKRVGYQCQRRDKPNNSFITGSSWNCKNGYKRVGNQCQKMVVSAEVPLGVMALT